MRARKSYITVRFFLLLTLVLMVMILPTYDIYISLIDSLISIEWLKMSVSAVVSGSSLILFLWLGPKTSILIEE
ncbi:hypothetical protein [Pseudoalteromonas prydzensis]|uniref:hypothetical protein n=1 Tax=Pseudoalteromonas prydzensis TaxID=182141 RepID=UPI003FD4DEEE